MKRKEKYIIVIVIVCLLIGFSTGCRRKDTEDPQQPPNVGSDLENGDNQGNDEDNTDKDNQNNNNSEDNNQNKKAPIIGLENQYGEEVAINPAGYKLTLISFWVDWSQESKEQLKVLENLYPLLQDEIQFVGIHATGFDTLNKEEVIDKIKLVDYSYTMVIDEESEAQQLFYIGSFPTTILMDEEGNILLSLTSVIKEDELLDKIEMLLEEFLP